MRSLRIRTRSRTKEDEEPSVTKRKRPASQVFEDNHIPGSTPSSILDQPGSSQLKVPLHLYTFIQRALKLREQLQRSRTPPPPEHEHEHEHEHEQLTSELEVVNSIIADYTQDYILSGLLPSDWKYDPATAHTLVSKTVPEKTSHTQQKMTPNPCIQYVQLSGRGLEAWQKFKVKDAAAEITAHSGISYPIDKNTITRLNKSLALFSFIGDFAVNAFNKSYQMYVNNDRNENIQSAQYVKSYYHKLSSSYLFHMTIEATEQGYAGSYEATVECKFDDGAITLDTFIHKHRNQSPFHLHEGMSVFTKRSKKYETVEDGLSDPEESYEVSGMVRRRTKWGGYDFHNPNGWNRLRNY